MHPSLARSQHAILLCPRWPGKCPRPRQRKTRVSFVIRTGPLDAAARRVVVSIGWQICDDGRMDQRKANWHSRRQREGQGRTDGLCATWRRGGCSYDGGAVAGRRRARAVACRSNHVGLVTASDSLTGRIAPRTPLARHVTSLLLSRAA